jgi:hypothetical protein
MIHCSTKLTFTVALIIMVSCGIVSQCCQGFFLNIFIVQTVYTMCTRINYKIVPVTSLNKYLHYSTSGTEYVYKYRCN